jgi:hypothetical protein
MVLFPDNLKASVWVAPGSVTNGVRQYGTPVEYRLNVRTTNGFADIMAFGPAYTDYKRAVADNDYVSDVNALDRVWIDGTPSDPTDVFANDADFYVTAKNSGQGGICEVLFKKLSADV